MTAARPNVRRTALTLGLCLGAWAANAQQQSDPSQATAPSATKPAPIVRATPSTASPSTTQSGKPSTAPASTSADAPHPIHLTVAKPVAKSPQAGAPASGTSSPGTAGSGATAPAAKPLSLVKPTAATGTAAAKTPVAKPATVKSDAGKPPVTATAPGSAPMNRNVILLDPAHGGGDAGSRINDQLTEKDITLALAFKLRSLLAARGFNVTMTRDSDAAESAPGTPLTLDDRAGTANHAHPVACLLMHATASGSGVHLYSSELDPIPAEPAVNPWLTAQAAWVPQSQKLVNQLGTALTRAHIPLVQSRASIRPVDSLTCPAVVLELAPEGGNVASLSDAGYQQRIADAVAAALVFWQNQAQPPAKLAPVAPPPAAASPTVASPASSSEVHP